MKLSPRERELVIKQWVRTIGTTKYRFTVTYLPNGEVCFRVLQRLRGARYELPIHQWTVYPDGKITGVYRRSNQPF